MATDVQSQSPALAVCAHCGCQSTLPKLFQQVRDGLLCPACAERRELRNKQIFASVLLLVLVSDILGHWLLTDQVGQYSVMVLLPLLVGFLLLFFHELSHAAAGWLLGGRVFGIHLGTSRLLFRCWLGNFYLGISWFPTNGVCYVDFPPGPRTPLRYGLMVLAGPLFHLLLLLLLLLGLRVGLEYWLLTTFVLNVTMLVFNLWPGVTGRTVLRIAHSDGHLLYQLWHGQITAVQLEQNYYHAAALFALYQKRYTQALTESAQGLVRYPDNQHLREMYGYALLSNDRLAESLIVWQALIDTTAPEANPTAQALSQASYYNNYAWARLMLPHTPTDLAIASDYAERAFAMTPWATSVRGTLGVVKVARGDYADGIALALAAAEEHRQERHPRALEGCGSNLATAALGYYHQGNAAEARRLLAEAQTLAPCDPAVRQAERVIGSE